MLCCRLQSDDGPLSPLLVIEFPKTRIAAKIRNKIKYSNKKKVTYYFEIYTQQNSILCKLINFYILPKFTPIVMAFFLKFFNYQYHVGLNYCYISSYEILYLWTDYIFPSYNYKLLHFYTLSFIYKKYFSLVT